MRQHPLRNRVTPFGEIIAHPARGLFMGNRGRLHDACGRLGQRRWTTKAWICCLLDFKGRRREVMAPGRYTELFFLDEATALSAGHRPCFECRRTDARRFASIWSEALGGPATAKAMDDRLHGERLPDRDGVRRVWESQLGDLPDGAFVLSQDKREAVLLWQDALYPWQAGGYGEAGPKRGASTVSVLTPPSIVAVLRNGYVPATALHPAKSIGT